MRVIPVAAVWTSTPGAAIPLLNHQLIDWRGNNAAMIKRMAKPGIVTLARRSASQADTLG